LQWLPEAVSDGPDSGLIQKPGLLSCAAHGSDRRPRGGDHGSKSPSQSHRSNLAFRIAAGALGCLELAMAIGRPPGMHRWEWIGPKLAVFGALYVAVWFGWLRRPE